MFTRLILAAIVALAMVPQKGEGVAMSDPSPPPLASPCAKHPVLTTTKGAHKRARRGWDAKAVKERPKAQRRVRLQASCVPDGKPQRFVRKQIRMARADYKKAKKASFPTPEEVGVSTETLRAIAECETGGTMDPEIHDPSGTYHGLFQFDLGTWASVGGSGDPHTASEDEQYYRAALLYKRSGSSPWPVCG